MNKSTISNAFKKAKKATVKHSPEILTVMGIGGMVTSVIFAVKATPKAMRLIEEKKQEEEVDELSKKEVVNTCWKCYIPTAAIALTSAGCIIFANSIHTKRHAALAAAYEVTRGALIDYRSKVKDTIGEAKEKKIREEVAADKIEKHPVGQVYVTGEGRCSRCPPHLLFRN